MKVKKLYPDAQLPTYATEGSACFDLYAYMPGVGVIDLGGTVWSDDALTFDTGLAFEIPPGWCMLIFSRSGHGFKNDVRLANCVGVIDSDYREEVKVRLSADQPLRRSLGVKHGDRIAQGMLVPVERVTFEEVDFLDKPGTRSGGFGSTGR
jgi:dUTP pyrophosphatase